MKKIVLALVAMIMAANAVAYNNYVKIQSVEPRATQDYLMYVAPCGIENEADQWQKIVTDISRTAPGVIPSYVMQHFLVECVVSPDDFQKGVTDNVNLLNEAQKATAAMPARAKVVGLALPGELQYTNPADVCNSLKTYVFIKNLSGKPSGNPPYKDISYSKLLKETPGGGFVDDGYFYDPSNNYEQVINKANAKIRKIDSQGADNPYALDMMFDTPFLYDGDYIHIALELTPCTEAGVESTVDYPTGNQYSLGFRFKRTKSTFEDATTYHSYRNGNTFTTEFNFYPGSEQSVIDALSALGGTVEQRATMARLIFNYFNFQSFILPGFQLTYYTNDIRGTVHDANNALIQEDVNASNVRTDLQPNGRPLIRLKDIDTGEYIKPDGVDTLNINDQNPDDPHNGTAEVNADGTFSFSNLDHKHTYVLFAESSTCGWQEKVINFDTGIVPQSTMLASAPRTLDADNAFKNDLICDIVMQKDNNVVTGIEELSGSASLVAVEYYNVAGMRSDTPFDGVNIVVTRYANGSSATSKMVK